jgi:hypothetical protein
MKYVFCTCKVVKAYSDYFCAIEAAVSANPFFPLFPCIFGRKVVFFDLVFHTFDVLKKEWVFPLFCFMAEKWKK